MYTWKRLLLLSFCRLYIIVLSSSSHRHKHTHTDKQKQQDIVNVTISKALISFSSFRLSHHIHIIIINIAIIMSTNYTIETARKAAAFEFAWYFVIKRKRRSIVEESTSTTTKHERKKKLSSFRNDLIPFHDLATSLIVFVLLNLLLASRSFHLPAK